MHALAPQTDRPLALCLPATRPALRAASSYSLLSVCAVRPSATLPQHRKCLCVPLLVRLSLSAASSPSSCVRIPSFRDRTGVRRCLGGKCYSRYLLRFLPWCAACCRAGLPQQNLRPLRRHNLGTSLVILLPAWVPTTDPRLIRNHPLWPLLDLDRNTRRNARQRS